MSVIQRAGEPIIEDHEYRIYKRPMQPSEVDIASELISASPFMGPLSREKLLGIEHAYINYVGDQFAGVMAFDQLGNNFYELGPVIFDGRFRGRGMGGKSLEAALDFIMAPGRIIYFTSHNDWMVKIIRKHPEAGFEEFDPNLFGIEWLPILQPWPVLKVKGPYIVSAAKHKMLCGLGVRHLEPEDAEVVPPVYAIKR